MNAKKDKKLGILDDELKELVKKQQAALAISPLTLKDINSINELAIKLEPYKCPQCSKVVYNSEKPIIKKWPDSSIVRFHPECFKKREIEIERFGKEYEEQQKRLAKVKYDVAHSLKIGGWYETLSFRGLKKDRNAFMKEVKELMKKYNLE